MQVPQKILIIMILFLLTACGEIVYDPDYILQPDYVLKAAGVDIKEYISELNATLATTKNAWALGDTHLVLARSGNSNLSYYQACLHYKKYDPENNEEQALLYETLASLNCTGKRNAYLKKAIKTWKKEEVFWRSTLLQSILDNENPTLVFNTTPLTSKLNLSEAKKILIGTTQIEIGKNKKVITQVDRVYRDWLGQQLFQDPFSGEFLVTFSERLSYNASELREDIGWHEGGRAHDIYKKLGTKATTATGTLAAQKNGNWYAADEQGRFQFEIPIDKISYPTTRFLTQDLALLFDTHGVNMLVEQSIRKKAEVVLSDCDHEGKVKAALYLSDHNISVLCFPDRFVYLALGHDAKLMGSPVWYFDEKEQKMIYGNSPLVLERNQKIVVTNAEIGKTYAVWYYTTPWLYFSEINKTFPLQIIEVSVDDFYQTHLVFEKARKEQTSVVATRVFNSYDYDVAKQWLLEDEKNNIILFHSTMYPYGILLMQEFKDQISFDDPNVRSVT